MKTSVLLVLLLLAGQAHAQLTKCKGPDGKITYSDVACDNKSTEGAMTQGSVSTLDTSGLRAQAAKSDAALARQPKPVAQKQKNHGPCYKPYAKPKPTSAEAREHIDCLKGMNR